MKIILVRHGENGGPPFGCPKRPATGYLSVENGLRQAQELCESLKDVKIDLAFSSPYGRALQTAEIAIGKRNIPIKILPSLKEWTPDMSLEHLPSTEFEKINKMVSEKHAEETWKTELGEGTFDMYARICPPFLKELDAIGIHSRMGGFVIDENARDMVVAVFAHGGSLCILLSFLLGLMPFPIGRFSLKLTGTAVIEYNPCRGIYYPSLVIPAPGKNPF